MTYRQFYFTRWVFRFVVYMSLSVLEPIAPPTVLASDSFEEDRRYNVLLPYMYLTCNGGMLWTYSGQYKNAHSLSILERARGLSTALQSSVMK